MNDTTQFDSLSPNTPRIIARDDGDHWAWTNANGRTSRREKALSPLPAYITEVSHGRPYDRSRDSTRSILLLPPTP